MSGVRTVPTPPPQCPLSRPAPSLRRCRKYHLERMRIHSIENVLEYGDFVSLGSSVIDIRAAQRSEVVQHQMDVTSNGRGRPGEFGYSRSVSRSKRFVNGPSCSQRLWIFDLNPGLRRPGFITRREKRSKARATALSSVRTAPTTAPSWNLLFARGVQR